MDKIDKSIFKDLTILYVEDDKSTQEEISFFLEKSIKKLYIASNGKEGLELFEKHNIDMIITDIQMPVMNGLEMSEKILQINPNIPIIVTTAYSDGDFLMKAIEMGIDKYVVKPINMSEILRIIQKYLESVNSLNNDLYYKDYIRFLLESTSTFVIVIQSDEVEYINNRFLEILEEESQEHLKNNHFDNMSNLFELVENKDENWIEYVIKHNNKAHLVKLKSTSSDIKFYVKYRKFDFSDKSLLIFLEPNEQRLKEINLLSKAILEQDKKCEEAMAYVEKINELSNIL